MSGTTSKLPSGFYVSNDKEQDQSTWLVIGYTAYGGNYVVHFQRGKDLKHKSMTVEEFEKNYTKERYEQEDV